MQILNSIFLYFRSYRRCNEIDIHPRPPNLRKKTELVNNLHQPQTVKTKLTTSGCHLQKQLILAPMVVGLAVITKTATAAVVNLILVLLGILRKIEIPEMISSSQELPIWDRTLWAEVTINNQITKGQDRILKKSRESHQRHRLHNPFITRSPAPFRRPHGKVWLHRAFPFQWRNLETPKVFSASIWKAWITCEAMSLLLRKKSMLSTENFTSEFIPATFYR